MVPPTGRNDPLIESRIPHSGRLETMEAVTQLGRRGTRSTSGVRASTANKSIVIWNITGTGLAGTRVQLTPGRIYNTLLLSVQDERRTSCTETEAWKWDNTKQRIECVAVSIIYRTTKSRLDLNGGKLRKWLIC